MIHPISFVAVGDKVGDGVQVGLKVFVGNGVQVGRVVGDKVGEGINVWVGRPNTVILTQLSRLCFALIDLKSR